MRLFVTGATGFLGWRTTVLLRERGHDVLALARPGGAARAVARGLDTVELDAGDPAARDLIQDRDAVLHFAGMPDPARSRADPARAVRENAGTTLNLLEGCEEHGAGLVYASSLRVADDPGKDPYATSKWLGEEACRVHRARTAVLRLSSVFGPGQVTWEGATGAIAAFAARSLEGRPIVIPGDPARTRDFLYVDDLVDGIARLVEDGRWGETLVAASGVSTSLLEAAELVRSAAGADIPIELPGGDLPPGENDSYLIGAGERLTLAPRPLAETVPHYVDWLRDHPAAQGRTRG
jgi:UDP-glucose 4-epimerase